VLNAQVERCRGRHCYQGAAIESGGKRAVGRMTELKLYIPRRALQNCLLMSEARTLSDLFPSSLELQTYFQHLLDVRDLCQDYNRSIGERGSDLDGLWSASLFLRSVVALNAAILLIQSKFYDDAAIIIRTLFEIELQLSAIKADPEIAKRLVIGTEKHRGKRLKAIGERGNELPGGVTQEAVASEIEKIKAADIPSEIKKRQLAEKSGDAALLYAYDTLYSLLSDVAHVSPTGLGNYLERDASSGKLKLNPNNSLFSPAYLMALAAATQLNILDLTMHVLRDPSVRADELRKQNGTILSKIRDAGTI